jgi:hypothetical protein
MDNETRKKGRFFFFGYPTAPKSWRNRGRFSRLDLHRVRDGTMVLDLCPTLYALGYQYGGTILNLPHDAKGSRRDRSEFRVTRSDMLVLPTRAPLDDSGRRGISKSGTILEGHVHDALRVFFSHLDRKQATLTDRLAAVLQRDSKKYASIEYEVYGGAHVTSYCGAGEQAPETPVTVAFLAACPQLWEGGPRLLAAFGAGGLETLTWGWLLRERFSHLVRKAVASDTNYLVMATFEVPKAPLGPILEFDVTALRPTMIFEGNDS